MNEFAITSEGLCRDFGALHALDGLSIRVPAGSVYGFLGPNGAGKTTTIRLLLGLLEPTAGRAEVLGYDTRTQAAAIRERCGALLEHTGLYERLSAEDNLEFYGRIYHLSAPERAERIRTLLSHFGLYERRADKVGTWSHGMRQKLAVARAMLHRPPLIFLDEPTSGLDPIASAELRGDLSSLASKEGVTVFLTTHNLAEAEKLCHEVAVIRQGRLLAQGTLAELRARSGLPRLEVNGSGFTPELLQSLRARPEVASAEVQDGRLVLELQRDAESAPLVTMLVAGGAEVAEVRRAETSLEDLFLSMMEEQP
ncbi:MAG: ABC transporter ATP-binding protein [Chloroflexi bacterium]|nr:ABC transporter ATP-binding protein [Chloroflexota bacterium]